ncbi:MAG TPA: 2-oxoglutarate dehydrogenase E1 component [Patescibacteria group bacterium]|nr:2-oxoglutarate dehydrogenase E1 component [Patescibacteria group bacterium]
MSQRDTLSFLTAAGPDYIAEQYARFAKNPGSVDASWADLFGSLGDEAKLLVSELSGASWTPAPEKLAAVLSTPANTDDAKPAKKDDKGGKAAPAADARATVSDSLRVFLLMRSYQVRGHLMADLDPLGLMERKYHPELDPKTYGFSDADMDRAIHMGGAMGIDTAPLRDIVRMLQETYCGTIGVEFMHIQDPEQKAWLQQKFEQTRNRPVFPIADRRRFLERLTAAEGFEKFLDTKFTGTKRFGVEGGESVIPAVEEVINRGAQLGIKEVIFGMAHRGRLNVLTNVLSKPFTAMFSEFQGTPAKPDDVQGSGDVKYHMGTSADRDFGGTSVHMSLVPNPSHLEFVDPVVVGKARAKQALRKDSERQQVLGILIHGDAALSGQGIVPETLMMSDLPGYRVGGTMHIVINNQIGFTTAPLYSRSGNYCTDVAKMIQSPIFHVNGDDVDAVMHVARMAIEFRQAFKKDVFIDIICYRRHGHNESDEPAFTQPQMYKVIKDKATTRTVYAEKLATEGVLSREESDKIYADFNAHLEREFQAATSYKPNRADMLEGHWSGLKVAYGEERSGETSVSNEMAQKIGRALTTVPDGFDLNSKIARQLDAKKKMFETGEGFDWATAEALAFGALALEGHRVRLSGQDCGRGTFSHRHAALTDQTNEFRYIPLNNIDDKQAKFEVHDSPLSEAAVMGFEYGYSTADPNALVLWEGQFGDFANGAQVIIDQFIASAETKWLRMSALVLLLPHGFEGQGPEHSSGRLERFLQLSAEDNWQVLNCSTPANYFHALRRQLRRDFRKPLVLMTPKSLLRHKLCVSPLKDMTGDTRFHRVLGETATHLDKDIRRVVLCSGKVYYDLLEAREKRGAKNVALVRVEQFYPFPEKPLADELKKYPNAQVIWCQEEPENQGAWFFLDRKIEGVLKGIKHKADRPSYVGRPPAAAPATGSLKTHNKEQEALIAAALTI